MRGQRLTGLDKSIASKGRYGSTFWGSRAEDEVWLANWRKHGLGYCSLYVVSTDSQWPCKIGVSVSPQKRLTQLQVSSWKALEVSKCVWLETIKEAKQLEKAVHETLSEDGVWLNGEWFDMRPEHAIDLIKFKAQVLGLEYHEKVKDSRVLAEIEGKLRRLTSHTKQYDRIEKEN